MYDAPIDIGELQLNGFKNEREMCDYLELNIQAFTKDVCNETYQSHIREYAVRTGRHFFGKKTESADFLIVTKSGKRILIEVKNPTHIASETIRSVSQLLAYGALADLHKPVDELLLVTSNTCGAVQLMIQKYELPVTVVLFTKDILATWDSAWSKQWQDQPL